MTAPPNKPTPKEMVRLTKDVYDDLEKQALPLVVTTTTTSLQTAYIAGQQSILKLLRGGYVVGG
jgi:hypothetical protein